MAKFYCHQDKDNSPGVFFNSQGMVYNHYVPKGRTVNSAFIVDVPQEFLRHLKRERPHLEPGEWFLQSENAPDYSCQAGGGVLGEKKRPYMVATPALFKHTSISSSHVSRVCKQDLIEIIPPLLPPVSVTT